MKTIEQLQRDFISIIEKEYVKKGAYFYNTERNIRVKVTHDISFDVYAEFYINESYYIKCYNIEELKTLVKYIQ